MVELAAGDRVVFFTDGITEACSPDRPGAEGRSAEQGADEFGETRLLELIAGHRHEDAEQLQEMILGTVGEYCRGHWDDDATLIVLAVE